MAVELPPRPPVIFAHPSEAEIARLLDFYGIHWEYEPRAFPLETDPAGRVTQSFSPDFYLPDYDLFLEITTIRPALINRKNRKIRKLRALYPEVNIKLFSLKDVEALLHKYQWDRPTVLGGEQASEGRRREAQKNLSDPARITDFTAGRSTASTEPTVPTDLSTHQDRTERKKP